MTFLDSILRFFSIEEYSNRQDVAIIISDIFEQDPNISVEDFKKKVRSIKRDFFRFNDLNRDKFAEKVFDILNAQKKYQQDGYAQYNLAKDFITEYFEIGFDRTKHLEFRKALIDQFSTIRQPHEAIMRSMNQLLTKLTSSFSIDLHGVKEYSGIDIAKDLKGSVIGFQIKTRSDDISENMILSEVTRAQNYKVNGFVLVYARKRTKTVESSMEGAFHIFKRLRDSKVIYSAVIEPELLAELFRKYEIQVVT